MMKGLLVGDPHSRDNISNRRFRWLAHHIDDEAPDFLVIMGDLADNPSLSSYDKGKKSFEGRRYAKDLKAANEALDIMSNAKRWDKIRKIFIRGNHENRRERAMELSAELDGVLDDIKVKEYGFIDVPYLTPYNLEGFIFQHYFGSGIMQRPIGGDNHAVTLLKTLHQSCVQAHTHLFGYAERARADGRKIQAFIPGCYLDPNQWEDYAGPANNMWWKGTVTLENVRDGYARDWKRTSIASLQARYGKAKE